jgi:hypothetical protein
MDAKEVYLSDQKSCPMVSFGNSGVEHFVSIRGRNFLNQLTVWVSRALPL